MNEWEPPLTHPPFIFSATAFLNRLVEALSLSALSFLSLKITLFKWNIGLRERGGEEGDEVAMTMPT